MPEDKNQQYVAEEDIAIQKESTGNNEGEPILLTEGKSKVIDAAGVAKVIVSNPDVVKVGPQVDNNLLITGKKRGESDVIAVMKTGELVRRHVKVTNRPAPDVINAELKRLFPMSDVRVRGEDETLFLEGSAASNNDLDGIIGYLKGITDKIVNLTRTGNYKQINLEVKMVEINRSKLKNLGINSLGSGSNVSIGVFSPSTLGSYNLGRGSFSFSNLSSPLGKAFNVLLGAGDISSIISILEGNSLAKTLTNPSVVAEDGKEAKLFVGGSIPVPIPQTGGTIAIEWKDFGIRLEFLPRVLTDGKISLKVKAEAGNLSPTTGVSIQGTAVPAIETRRVENEITVAERDNIVIGGLFYNKQNKTVKKIPLLGDIPFLGVFFKNVEESNDELELIAVITPKFVAPSKEEEIKILKEAKPEELEWKDFLMNRF